jgi:glycosyltransferase involved in cell wall biosynthesis
MISCTCLWSRTLKCQSRDVYEDLTRPQALAIVATSDLFVRPTLADGDAISVREALALGRPVVASDVGTRPRNVSTFPAGNAAACAEVIFHVLSNGFAEHTITMDCLPTLLALYRRLHASAGGVATGTALATMT